MELLPLSLPKVVYFYGRLVPFDSVKVEYIIMS